MTDHPIPRTFAGRRWICDDVQPGSLFRAWRHRLGDGRVVTISGLDGRETWRWRVQRPGCTVGTRIGVFECEAGEDIGDTIQAGWELASRRLK